MCGLVQGGVEAALGRRSAICLLAFERACLRQLAIAKKSFTTASTGFTASKRGQASVMTVIYCNTLKQCAAQTMHRLFCVAFKVALSSANRKLRDSICHCACPLPDHCSCIELSTDHALRMPAHSPRKAGHCLIGRMPCSASQASSCQGLSGVSGVSGASPQCFLRHA